MDTSTNEWFSGSEQVPSTAKSIEDVFKYHAPNDKQIKRYAEIRLAAKKFAECILRNTPKSADQTDAIRKVREAVMTANASIALE